MNLYSPFYIKTLLKQYNNRPRKSLGQNFVINKSVIDKIIQTADLKPNDTVLEIGPGIGALTIELAKRAQKVIAVEKDKALCNILQDVLQKNNLDNVAIIEGDALNFQSKSKLQNLNFQNYKLIANIPYYITQPIIRLFLESGNSPQEIILLVQKEVAQRICAQPPKMNLLAISVQFYAKPKIITYVSQNNFWPKPKVDSAIIRITPTDINAQQIQPKEFFKVVKAGFSAPRKMLINNLFNKLKIPKEKISEIFNQININQKARAENLSLADWQILAQNHDLSTSNFRLYDRNMV